MVVSGSRVPCKHVAPSLLFVAAVVALTFLPDATWRRKHRDVLAAASSGGIRATAALRYRNGSDGATAAHVVVQTSTLDPFGSPVEDAGEKSQQQQPHLVRVDEADATFFKREVSRAEQTELMRSMLQRSRARSRSRLSALLGSLAQSPVLDPRSVAFSAAVICQLCCLVHLPTVQDPVAMGDASNKGCSSNPAAPDAGSVLAEALRLCDDFRLVKTCGTSLTENDYTVLYEHYVLRPQQAAVTDEIKRKQSTFRNASRGRFGSALMDLNVSMEYLPQGEGVCAPYESTTTTAALNRVGLDAQRHWTDDELRVAFVTDLHAHFKSALAVLEHNVRPQYLSGERVRPHPTTALETNDFRLCMPPKLRAIFALVGSSQWMFDGSLRPPLLESDLTDSAESAPESPQPWDKSFLATFNIKNLLQLKKSRARNHAAFYSMRNVMWRTSPNGTGPLLGYGLSRPYSLDLLHDERWIRIRQLSVDPSSAPPRFLCKKALFLHPLIFASSNLGHVMFRYYSALELLAALRLDMRRTIFAYMVTPSAGLTFGSPNAYRSFYQALPSTWMSAMGFDAATTSTSAYPADDLGIAFDVAFIGTGGVAQFHRGQRPAMIHARTVSLQKLIPALQRVRNLMSECLQLAVPAVPRPTASFPAAPKRVVFVQRRNRRLLNLDALLEQYLMNHSATPDAAVVHDHGHYATITVVVLEFMTVRQQIDVVSQADILIGPMGAGLCWMMFMRPHATVVELHSIGMQCTGVGINVERMNCDYSKQSTAANLNHVGYPMSVVNCSASLYCDGSLSQDEFDALMLVALCTTGRAPAVAHRDCTRFMPPERKLLPPASGENPTS